MRRIGVGRIVAATVALLLAAGAGGAAIAADSPSRSPAPKPGTVRDVPGKWPKTIDEFLDGDYLRKSDVVLTSRKNDVASYLIRTATKSPFSHSALVFTAPNLENGYTSTFVIEAGTSGVDLTNLRDYVTDRSTFIAIKRFRRDWFDSDKQSRVRGLLLENIKSSYNYWAVVRIVRDIWFGIERTIAGKEVAVHNFKKRDWARPNTFICSGLVQFGFLETAAEYVLQDRLPPWELRNVMFTGDAAELVPPREAWEAMDTELRREMLAQVVPSLKEAARETVESITPDDLARSDRLEWLYYVLDGKVYQAESYEQVRRAAQ